MRMLPTQLARCGTILFIGAIVFAYAVYPHWLTLSHFAEHWYTLIPFALAMLIAALELWYLGDKLERSSSLRLNVSANSLRASAACAALVLCIPETANKTMHNILALLLVLLAAYGFAVIAKQLRKHLLGAISVVLVIICALELLLLAQYNVHPVYPWVWVILELIAIALLITGLYNVAIILEHDQK